MATINIDEAKLEKAKEQQQAMIADGIVYHQHQFCHFNGRMHMMEEAADNYAAFAKTGFGIDGSSIGFLHVTASDLTVVPDVDTFRIGQGPDCKFGYSWSYLYGLDNRPHPLCVRSALQRVVQKANSMGFVPEMFGELEFYLFKPDGSYFDTASYTSLPPEDKGVVYRHRLGRMMLESGILPKRLHHECGPGQNEIELKVSLKFSSSTFNISPSHKVPTCVEERRRYGSRHVACPPAGRRVWPEGRFHAQTRHWHCRQRSPRTHHPA